MNNSEEWYVVKQENGQCTILPANQIVVDDDTTEKWGPFESESEAIARRVGLIRSGKCQPV